MQILKFLDTEMVASGVKNSSQKLSSQIKKSIQDTGGLLSPSDIAESVVQLLTKCGSGTVLFSAKNTPNIIIPDVQNPLLMMLMVMAKIMAKMRSRSDWILQTWHQKLVLLCICLSIVLLLSVII